MPVDPKMQWKCHTPNLLHEILNNNNMSIFKIPVGILGHLLASVGERAAELNDPQLNALMCRLTIYSIADPEKPDFDPARVETILVEAAKTSAT